MTNIEINDLAAQVLNGITFELNNNLYANMDAELSFAWDDEKKFGASASIVSRPGEPLKHRITFHYELVRQIWRDAEDICQFLRKIPEGSGVDNLYGFYGENTKLPKCFTEEEHVLNMFIATITWVYFHELGHLKQQHGIICEEFGGYCGNGFNSTVIHDFAASAEKKLVGREALVSHVLELAADTEATNSYVTELIRHIVHPEFVSKEKQGEALRGMLYLAVCGISLLFYRFNGNRPLLPNEVIEGSHPVPLARLEFAVPQIYENLDFQRRIFDHKIERKELVLLCGKAGLSATLFWCMRYTEKGRIDSRFLLKGVLSNPIILKYLQPVVVCWDEILPRVKEIRLYGSPLGLLYFTDTFRHRISNVIVWGDGEERRYNNPN